ncbi:MAG: large subunit ribosomal protein L6 [Verrucomicrobiales bacterium]|jgi:large subunit ribosomal protein L6
MSRIGKLPISLPDKVEIDANDSGVVSIKGPRGNLSYQLPSGIALKRGDNGVEIERTGASRRHKALHGTARSLIANMVEGVSEGFVKQLEIQGVGYRAAVKGEELDLQLGFSHPVKHPIPEGLKVSVENNTEIKVEGIDKQAVGQFAAEIRSYRPPEPYKGKGVRYKGEYVRRKAGKSVK